jgi:hypothetical protein
MMLNFTGQAPYKIERKMLAREFMPFNAGTNSGREKMNHPRGSEKRQQGRQRHAV